MHIGSIFGPLLLLIVVKITHEFNDGGKVEVKVGVLFFRDEGDIEKSFDEAFRVINNNQLFGVSFETIKRYVPSDDSYILQQLTCELLSDGVAAIFGPSSKASSDIVAVIANATGIPHIEFDWKFQSTFQERVNNRMTVNVAPSIAMISKAYFSIIKSVYEWEQFTIVYETQEGLARLQDLLNIQSMNNDLVKLRYIGDYKHDLRVLWKEVRETLHENRIILDCSEDSLQILLETSMPFKLLGSFRYWFLSHLNTHNSPLRSLYNADYKANITSVRLKLVDENPYGRKKTRIRPIDEIFASQDFLPILMYDAVVLFANAARNVIISLRTFKEPSNRCELGYHGGSSGHPWYVGRQIVREMKTISEDDVEPPFKTENLKIDENGERSDFSLEIYKPTTNEILSIFKSDGTVAPPSSIYATTSSASTTPDFSLEKKFFLVATRFEEPYFMLKEDHENLRGMEKYEGYAVDLIGKLSEIMDFKYDFLIERGTGKPNPETGEWDGIIRRLIDHQAQIGICDITITQARRQVVDFTVPFMQLGISILFYRRAPAPKNVYAFLDPFAEEVWYNMMLTQLVMTLLFVLLARFSQHEWMNPNPADSDPVELENIWNNSNSFWLMIGSIMQQGCDILPKGPPMRILSGMWWFFTLMMVNAYIANLAASLTNNKLQSEFNSLESLVDQNKVKYGTLAGGSTSVFFSESNETDYKKAWNQMISFTPSAFTSSNKEGVDRVRKGQGTYAFLMETTSLSYNVERSCDLKQVGEQIGEKHYALAVPFGSEYRSNLSISLLQLSEKGVLLTLKRRWWTPKNASNCVKYTEVDGDELSIIELGGVFLALGGGVAVAFIIGVCEFLWNVQTVAVEEMTTPWQAFKAELCFVLMFWITKKPAKISESTKSSTSSKSSSKRSTDHSRSRSHSRVSGRSHRTTKSKASHRDRERSVHNRRYYD
ncbi:glutamate receptor ionotropic, kainate 2 isoform X1 [Anastrepha ludens]|uniref:glutamate receptor ionotropic, kainate 2 isoform X1 n=2 Tax=Anastrepha ludens TaxID=28586 RepID=UPI0023B13053|nr:glutamate receptor ionotropic, kainate 2 isoform X1 [Anastrepha ludens]XP_053961749.1 glutamate receptor ionotropic, kainate 2 isoform X1 [Anastrepha ludens]XP_053961750.1 glutamate receptor ionotropic, kainate 2 isoform X1 [Anastrepha ludens]